ncbi:MAG: hypothetical protein JOZ51_15850 [Chloroflexi bacterium]|nr:hypothetical protein [Chloroflexota bacterium]
MPSLSSESAVQPVQSAASASPPGAPKLSEVLLAMLGVTSAPAPIHAPTVRDTGAQPATHKA